MRTVWQGGKHISSSFFLCLPGMCVSSQPNRVSEAGNSSADLWAGGTFALISQHRKSVLLNNRLADLRLCCVLGLVLSLTMDGSSLRNG